jgi:transcriptional regulator with XRE-family HTH domain
MVTISRHNQIVAMQLRREHTQLLLSKGYTQREIAKELGVSLGLTNKDCIWIKKQAQNNLTHYINRTLPEEMELSLVRLGNIIRTLYQDVDDPSTSKKDKHSAIELIKNCTALRLEILGAGVHANQMNQQEIEEQAQKRGIQFDKSMLPATNNNSSSKKKVGQEDQQQQQ